MDIPTKLFSKTKIFSTIIVLLISIVVLTLRWHYGIILLPIMLGGSYYGSLYLFTEYSYLVDWSWPALTVFVVWSSSAFLRFMQEYKLRQQIKKQFEHYLDPRQVAILQKNPEKLKLGGERKEMSFLFMDIVGFTPISEHYKNNDDPEGLCEVINDYLDRMTKIVQNNGGTVDKYMGDCIMAFWNAPLDCADHQKKAILVAKDMRERMKKLDLGFNIGIGINSGTAVVGNMGSDQRFDYSVLGDAVNLASRLEGQSKEFNTTIVVGEDTYKNAEELHNRMYNLGSVTVKGKSNKVKIYSIK